VAENISMAEFKNIDTIKLTKNILNKAAMNGVSKYKRLLP